MNTKLENTETVNGITPTHIEIALHYFNSARSAAIDPARPDGVELKKICNDLAAAGLVEMNADELHCRATEKMRRYIESLCKVPLPAAQPELKQDLTARLDSVRGNKDIGESTTKTRNYLISAIMDEYMESAPQARL